MDSKGIYLVYQGGLANVFEVDENGERKLLLQDAFSPCAYFALGMAQAGCRVRTLACNRAGNIINEHWTLSLADQPFSEKFTIINRN